MQRASITYIREGTSPGDHFQKSTERKNRDTKMQKPLSMIMPIE